MINKPGLIAIFLFMVVLALAAGYIAFEIYEFEEVFIINFLQILILATLTVPLFLIEIDEETSNTSENSSDKTIDLSSRDPKADLKVVQDMAKQMLKTINEHIEEPCTVMGFKETELTYEIEWIINEDDFLKSYQEIAIIPYDKVHELAYWQEITRIIIRNNQLRKNPEQALQPKEQQRRQARQRKVQTKKRSRTKIQ